MFLRKGESPVSIQGVLTNTYQTYMLTIDSKKDMSDAAVADALLANMTAAVDGWNSTKGKGESKARAPQSLPLYAVAGLVMSRYHIRNIDMMGDRDADNMITGVYMENGPKAGTYSLSVSDIRKVLRNFSPSLSDRDMPSLMQFLRDQVPVADICREKHLIAVDNGIFHDVSKRLLPFTPELVFLSKIRTAYNSAAKNMGIRRVDGSVWDMESWMASLNSNADNIRLLWEVIGMMVRPNYNWNRMVLLYSEKGNNGKGTFCQLIRNLLGTGNYADLCMADFEVPYMLSNIMNVQAVLGDENPVGRFLDDLHMLKCCVTGDPICVNRKFKDPVRMVFHGMVLQCVNGMPRVRDQSDSWIRRLTFVTMDQSFTGREDVHIKSDYLARREILEYVLYKVLNMQLTEDTLFIPEASLKMQKEYKEFNDPVYEFWIEFKDRFVWDLLPYCFLYDLYKKWFAQTDPRGLVVSYKQFNQQIRVAVDNTGGWRYSADGSRPGRRMDKPEQLIMEWQLTDWMNGGYKGDDWRKQVQFVDNGRLYKGLLRI